jgi:hypothetical protein
VDVSSDPQLAASIAEFVGASIQSCLTEMYNAGGIPEDPADQQKALEPLLAPFLGMFFTYFRANQMNPQF